MPGVQAGRRRRPRTLSWWMHKARSITHRFRSVGDAVTVPAAAGSLTSQMVRGLGWTSGTLVLTTSLQLFYTAAISRLLEPSAFGLMAAAMLSLRFVTFFSHLGLASAVIQRAELDDRDVSTAVRLSISVGLGVGLAAALLAPLFAELVRMPDATNVIRWIAVGIPVGSCGGVALALLRRSLRFRAISLISILAYVVGYLVVGIATALNGWGVWSLVAATLSQSVVTLIAALLTLRPPLRSRYSTTSAKALVRFGGTVLITGLLDFLTSSIDTLTVGRYAGAGALGQYSRATYLVALPVENATTAVSRVLLPGLSTVQSEPRRFIGAVTMTIGLQTPVIMAGTAMIAAASPALVPWFLGPGWEEAAEVLPVVGVAYALALLTNGPAVAAEARGLVDRKLLIQAVSLLLTIVAVGIVVVTGPTLLRLASAWAVGQLLHHLLYWIFVFGSLGLDRRVIGASYRTALIIAGVSAAPSVLILRCAERTGLAALLIAAVGGLLLAAAIVFSPVGSQLRESVRDIRMRMAQPSERSDEVGC
jgi:lipopolysaccharide exporter